MSPASPRALQAQASIGGRPRSSGWLAVLALAALKCAVSMWALHIGFSHVSDDDFARVTLAQGFAHAPRLDPSGTSWLPFPFWLNGTVMMLLGRSLGVARAIAFVSSVAGALFVHHALLRSGTERWVAWCGVALAMCAPWSVWLGVSTVPEALCASLMVGAVLCLAAPANEPTMPIVGGVSLLAACLSRYEAWPVASVFAIACVVLYMRGRSESLPSSPQQLWGALFAIAGPLAWIGWNARAHGDPLHFLTRVAAYRVRITNSEAPTWLLYPEAFVRAGPLTLALAAVGVPGLFVDASLRKRWALPLTSIAALVLFLLEGDLHNGAPTHHPERALLAAFWVGATFGVDGGRSLAVHFVWARPKREAWFVGGATALAVGWGLVWPSRVREYPARSPREDRSEQLARGAQLRERKVAHLTVTPCAYEHFALLAAFEAPERVTLRPSSAAGVNGAGAGRAGDCPEVEEQ